MKVILQDFEPQAPIARNGVPAAVASPKPRVHLNPLKVELRLFHAL